MNDFILHHHQRISLWSYSNPFFKDKCGASGLHARACVRVCHVTHLCVYTHANVRQAGKYLDTFYGTS